MPAGKPEAARNIGSLGSGRPSGGRGSSTAPSGGVKKFTSKPTKQGTKAVNRYIDATSNRSVKRATSTIAAGAKKVRRAEVDFNKTNKLPTSNSLRIQAGKSYTGKQGTASRIVKPSAAGKNAVAKYSGKMKNTPKG
jgi:hypothetical protein